MKTFLTLILCSLSCFGYSWRGQVDLGVASSGTLTNITLATVTVSDTHLKTVANGGTINDATCSHRISNVPCDLIVTDDPTCGPGSTAFKWGFETYDGSAGTARIWILVPVMAATHVAPYICTDDASVHSYQGGAPGAEFDSSTRLAFHMSDSTSTLTDFSASANNATKKSAAQPAVTTSGKIGDAQTFVGTLNSTANDYVTFGSATSATNTYTLEAWVNQSSVVDHPALYIVFTSLTGGHTVAFGTTWFPAPATMKYFDSFNSTAPTAPASFNTGEWHHIVFVRNGDSANYYLDGVAGTAKTGLGTGTQTWVGLGYPGAASTLESIVGTVDEVRYSNVARGGDWITTEEANQSSPPAIDSFTDTTTGPPNSQSVIF
jgi:hypothetical protein